VKTKPNQSIYNLQSALPHFLGTCLISACLVLAGTGCKNEPGATAHLDPTGVYALVSVDGRNVPCDLVHEGVTLTIKSGVFTITADGHCNSQMNFSVPERGDMSREVKASYTRQGAVLTMQWEGAGMTMGEVNGNTFIMTNEDMVLAYRK